ncbi:hypothetical protein CBS101457_005813 [Exobasidium rhododendri]|nr:hypothetical protein CBS101457_005813 [Exobasidium rhododendri]
MTQQPSTSSHPQLRTKYKRERAFEPTYTGGAATALTPDGNYLFAPVNETIHITQVKSGKTINKIPSNLDDITCLSLSSDGTTLLVASRSLAIRVIQLEYSSSIEAEDDQDKVSWKVQRNIVKTHDAPIVVMQIDPTDTLLATGSSDGCAKVWDIRGGFCTHVFRSHGGIVSALEWNMPVRAESKKGSDRTIELFTGSMDGKVRLWDLKAKGGAGQQRPFAVLESHFSVVRGLSVNKEGTRLVSAGRDRLLTFWEKEDDKSNGKGRTAGATAAWKMIDSVTTGESMESSGFLPDDSDAFYTAGAEGEVRLWSFERRRITHVQPKGRFARGMAAKRKPIKSTDDEEEEKDQDDDETRAITEVHLLSSVNALVSIHADQNIVFRSIPSLQLIRRLVGFNDQIIDIALLSPGARLDSHLAVATNTNAISIYTLGSEEHSVELLPGEADLDQGHSGLVLCLDKTSDGKWLASGAKDRSVRIWARVAKDFSSDDDGASLDDSVGVRVLRNGEKVKEKEVELEWRCVAVAEGHTESVGAVAFARRPAQPDAIGAPFLVSGSQDRTAKVWDLSTLSDYIDKEFTSPLRLKALTTLKIHDKDINALDISPNNALLLSGSQDKTAKVFSIKYVAPSKGNSQTATAALKLVTTCRGHQRGIWSVAFSPNDAVFLTGSGDRSLKLWSINDGFSCIKNYIGHTNSVLKVRFLKGSKGMQCLSCASDGLVKLWNVKTEECVDTLDGHEDRIWGLECTSDGDEIISGAADSFICFWKDWTQKQEEEKVKGKQEEVEREQQFSNLLAVKDYRNAISLALAMKQPRRLFHLFSSIDSSREKGDASTSTGELLQSALVGDSHASTNGESRNDSVDPSLQALVRAGVLSSASARSVRPTGQTVSRTPMAASITGSEAVDHIIKTLSSSQLMILLTFVRDWNTSARTSHIAQIVLHAILRFHSADQIIDAYEQDKDKEEEDQPSSDEEDIRQKSSSNGQKSGQKSRSRARVERQRNTDLKSLLEAILPYTRRHYDRAQRLLTESSMLQYTLACMDSVLGAELDQEEEDGDGEKVPEADIILNGFHAIAENGGSDVEMASDESSDGGGDSDE